MPPPDPVGDAATPLPGFRHVRDELVVEGWRISLVRAHFLAPDGTPFDRDVVRHPGAVAVVPLTGRGTALLVRQYRGPVDRWVLEIPAGTRDVDGEPPEVTAGRELEEEVGVRADRLERLATVLNTPGFCDEETVLYAATGLTEVPSDRHGHEEEHIEVVEVALDDVDDLVRDGTLTDAQTVLGLMLARDRDRAAPGIGAAPGGA